MPERLITHADFGALAEEILKKGGAFHFQAHGNSMRPFIINAETIELIAAHPDQIRRGEVVLCWLGKENLLLHRVVRVQNTNRGLMFLVQGDASCWPDGMVPGENVLGRATAILRKGKWVSLDAFPSAFLSSLWILPIPIRQFAARVARKLLK